MIQLIHGTDVLLYSENETETVSNVLIGEPSADGKSYTLGIPAGDVHNWADRKLSFFGRTFRTVGLPVQGIAGNIPLWWNRNVRAEYTEFTGKCTVYENNSFTRHVFSDVFFYDGRGETVTPKGAQPADSVKAVIYSCSTGDGYVPAVGDIIVPGECAVMFDISSQEAVSGSMAQLRTLFPEGLPVVRTVERTLCGEKYEYRITAR